MPRKTGQCSNCGQVKTILAKGLCRSCYWRSKHPLLQKTCAYLPCSKVFYTPQKKKIYCSRKCKDKDIKNKYEYLRYVPKGKCPKCHGTFGELFKIFRKPMRKIKPRKPRIYYRIHHFRNIYLKGQRGKTKRKYTRTCTFTSLPKI